jgi:cold shock CspA family protein
VLVARDGLRSLAGGAKVKWKLGETATRAQATNVRVI